MSNDRIHTRREFLRTGLVGSALTWSVPGFLHLTMQELDAALKGQASRPKSGEDSPILVVIQLAGGNDGLNTIVPYTNDHYYKARPQLGLKKKECLRLTDSLGMQKGMEGMKELYDNGNLTIVQGVGYPNPNRSHFRATEIWHTASDSEQFERHGWIGRYFDNQCRGEDAGVGVAIGNKTPQAFFAAQPKGITFQNPHQYRYVGTDEDSTTGMAESELFMDLNSPDEDAGGSIGSLAGGGQERTGESPLAFLERTALDAQVSSDQINDIVGRVKNEVRYPKGRLSADLQTIAKLIAGDMTTRIYYASTGGFDTHNNQAGAHANLVTQFSGALNAFVKDMKAQGNLDRVMVLVFSEFGRRVKENGSAGTDHGAAAPLFVIGGNMKSGLHGNLPSLAPEDLHRGDLKHNVDFRSVYATLLQQHMGVTTGKILKGSFPTLNLFPKA